MFYFENLQGKRVLKSDYIKEVCAFFTTRDGFDKKVLNAKRVIRPEQTHSTNVKVVSAVKNYPDTDSLILMNENDAVMLKFADCTPLILYDNKNKIGAVAHAGWRGTAGKIGVKTVEKMVSLGSKMENISVLIGPAISLCCYEVGEDVKKQLLSTVKNTENLFDWNKVDLKGINARQLQEIGINKIDICPFCTVCNNDLFYSYRKENGTNNRHYAVLKLNFV